jgi:hypothetical protein
MGEEKMWVISDNAEITETIVTASTLGITAWDRNLFRFLARTSRENLNLRKRVTLYHF